MRLWQGIRLLFKRAKSPSTAQHIVSTLDDVSNSYEGLIKLKGIGTYTAAAIASLCIQRTGSCCRWKCIPCPITCVLVYMTTSNPIKVKNICRACSKIIITFKNTATYNRLHYGVWCTTMCSFLKILNVLNVHLRHPIAFQNKKTRPFPKVKQKIKTKHRHFHYFIFSCPKIYWHAFTGRQGYMENTL